MSVWLCIPSARPASEIKERLERWRDMGYKIALWRNGLHRNDVLGQESNKDGSFIMYSEEYRGWGISINTLIDIVAKRDPQADWFVGGGDDTDPDPTERADVIALQCVRRFGGIRDENNTFGVMQPTGDRWGADEPWAKAMFPEAPAYIDRICGSPWIGREFARRVNQGKGPFWPEYRHMFADEEFQCVAQRLGVLWQRPDLIHMHHHPLREGVLQEPAVWQREIYSSEHWQTSKRLFESRKAAGFPGSEPMQ
jgi:hypothetical protein